MSDNYDLVESLKETTAGVRLAREQFGARRALTDDQVGQAAETFEASGDFLTARKKLIDTKHPAYRAVQSILNDAGKEWKLATLPYPLDGVRLIRRDDLETFESKMAAHKARLAEACEALELEYADLKEAARKKLGELYNEKDYPESISNRFSIRTEVVNLSPPDYLATLNPELYAREQARVRAEFESAVALAEEAFTKELEGLLDHLVERLSGEDSDGKKKVFRDSAIDNLTDFLDRFKKLNIGSDKALDELVDKAKAIVGGEEVTAKRLRNDTLFRDEVAGKFAELRGELDQHLKLKPKRKLSLDDESPVVVDAPAA